MSKYAPLTVFLAAQTAAETPMTFSEIETVIGAPLPPAAGRHRAWWSNNSDNSVATRAWRDAGYRAARVDMAARTLVFRRDGADEPIPAGPQSALLARIRARLGGTVSIPVGVDASAPTGEVWDAEIQ